MTVRMVPLVEVPVGFLLFITLGQWLLVQLIFKTGWLIARIALLIFGCLTQRIVMTSTWLFPWCIVFICERTFITFHVLMRIQAVRDIQRTSSWSCPVKLFDVWTIFEQDRSHIWLLSVPFHKWVNLRWYILICFFKRDILWIQQQVFSHLLYIVVSAQITVTEILLALKMALYLNLIGLLSVHIEFISTWQYSSCG